MLQAISEHNVHVWVPNVNFWGPNVRVYHLKSPEIILSPVPLQKFDLIYTFGTDSIHICVYIYWLLRMKQGPNDVVSMCHNDDGSCIFIYYCLFTRNICRRIKTRDGKGNTKSLKWISNNVEDLADANGNIEAAKLKERMRETQVYIQELNLNCQNWLNASFWKVWMSRCPESLARGSSTENRFTMWR